MTRTITMSNRRPVRIEEADWPIIAEARGDSFAGNDYARHQQALAQGEIDEFFLKVRRHQDGRMIVYGALLAAEAWTGSKTRRAGELLPAGTPDEALVEAIRRVAEDCGIPDDVVRRCIADLPAEMI